MFTFPLVYSALTGGLFSTAAFALYITFNPGMKGMAIRPDDTGEERCTPLNLVRLAVAPFHDCNFWKVSFLDLNYLVWLTGGMCSGCMVYTVKNIF